MARIKDKDQKMLLRAGSKKFGLSENELLYLMFDMGIAWFVFINKPKSEQQKMLKNIGINKSDEDSELLWKISKWFYDNWVAGQDPSSVTKRG